MLVLGQLFDATEVDNQADDAKYSSHEQTAERGPGHKSAKQRAGKRDGHGGTAKPDADGEHAGLIDEASANAVLELATFDEKPKDEEQVASNGEADCYNDSCLETKHIRHSKLSRRCNDESGGVGIENELISQGIERFAGFGNLAGRAGDVAVEHIREDGSGEYHGCNYITPSAKALSDIDVWRDECDTDANDGNPVGDSDTAVGASKPALVNGVHCLEYAAESVANRNDDGTIPRISANDIGSVGVDEMKNFLDRA